MTNTTSGRTEADTATLTDLPTASPAATRRGIIRTVRKYPVLLGITFLGYTAGVIAGTTIPRELGNLTERLRNGASFAENTGSLWMMAGLAVIYAVLTGVSSATSGRLGAVMGQHIRNEFMHNTAAAPLGLLERTGTGRLVGRVTQDVGKVAEFYSFAFLIWFSSAVLCVVSLGQIAFGTGWFGIITIPFIALVWWRFAWYLKRSGTGYLRVQAGYATAQGVATETINSGYTVDSLGLAPVRLAKTLDASRGIFVAVRYTSALRIRTIPWVVSGTLTMTALGIAMACVMVPAGQASLADAVSLTALAAILYPAVRTCAYMTSEWQLADVAMARLLGVSEVVDHRADSATTHQTTTPPSDEPGRIVVQDAQFSYRPDVPVLQGVTLDLQHGERVTIVGPSGSGKSTLARLIAGLSTPIAGTVHVGGHHVAEIPAEELRDHVALLTQEQHVFAMTLAENLRLGAPDATDEDIHTVLKAVAAQDWVDHLADGIHTAVGESGHTLDPAQAQQIALARLLLINPAVIILDEATSLLDPDSARAVEQALSRLLDGRTVITIAHQLYSAQHADRVVYMTNGDISEQGSHTELMAAGGAYADLYTAWESTK